MLPVTTTPTPKPVPDPNGTKLYRVLVLNKEQPGKNIDIYEYHYDYLNRVTEIGQYLGDSLNGKLQLKYNTGITFFYNTGEQLPYKSTGPGFFDSTAESYYFYDSNRRVIIDSERTTLNKFTITRYNWQSDSVYCSYTIYNQGESTVTGIGASINNQNITRRRLLSPLIADVRIDAYQYGYDDKVNPFNKLNISALKAIHFGKEQLTFSYSKNNLTREAGGRYNYKHEFKEVDVETYTYQYNHAGLPVACEISGLKYKWLMEYY